jgi:cellulose synthase/poly-beta-1,6-N-acetylglucosamine synthase-like glycosyltransferase
MNHKRQYTGIAGLVLRVRRNALERDGGRPQIVVLFHPDIHHASEWNALKGVQMETLVSGFLVISAALLALPVAILLIEVIAAITSSRRHTGPHISANYDLNRSVVVLVPAHNESTAVSPTLADIKQQLRASDRMLVVADNCTDDTAAVALAGGAEVVVRHDPGKCGKGYALDFGLGHLNLEPPQIVIMVDADCRLAENAIDELAKTCAATRQPVQALYLMTAPDGSQINHKVAEFAWRVKNWLRPLGLKALGLPCQLMGTGMAFPWDVIHCADLASGSVVEDLKLGLDLTSKGHPPVFCPSATVTSQFASSAKAARTQRERWEGGHIGMISTATPQLFCRAVAHRDWNLLALTLDLAVPPLSLLAILVIAMFAVTASNALLGFSSAAAILSTAALVAFVLAACLAWLKCGRDVVPLAAVLSIVPYVLGKLGLYRVRLLNKTDTQWIRTDRTKSD